jgi:excisionase family DNA binding protein
MAGPLGVPTRERALLTLPEAAAYLNVSRETVGLYVRRGELPLVKFTPSKQGTARITLADLDDFIARKRSSATPR